MAALLMLALSGTACLLFAFRNPGWPVPGKKKTRNAAEVTAAGVTRHRKKPAAQSTPRLVRQLASLLAAGRTGPTLWQAMAQVRIMEMGRAPSATTPDATLTLVLAVQRASTMGLSSASAIHAACQPTDSHTERPRPRAGPETMTAEQRRMWLDIAACFAVCEASGAPVAAVLQRLAATLEADHDAAAQRQTALAGPRATVRLLTWLPAVGLGLGMLMGVDPLGALFDSATGWAILAAGLGFAVAGRFWSAKLIRSAATPVVHSASPGG